MSFLPPGFLTMTTKEYGLCERNENLGLDDDDNAVLDRESNPGSLSRETSNKLQNYRPVKTL